MVAIKRVAAFKMPPYVLLLRNKNSSGEQINILETM